MKPATVDFLLKTLTDMAARIENCEERIKALETALRKYEPNQYQCYLDAVKTSQAIAQNSPEPSEPVETSILRAMLLQDQPEHP